MRFAVLVCCSVFAAFAQDERRILSPDGQLEFRVFVTRQEDPLLPRLAYQVWSKNKRIVETSFLGLEIWEQEPLLGENTGLTEETRSETPEYREWLGKFTQNGSTDRRIHLQVRAYRGAIAFRYIVPRTNMIEELRIGDETTEFVVPKGSEARLREVRDPAFPAMQLIRTGEGAMLTRLDRHPKLPFLAFEGVTPYACPWRLIVVDAAVEKKIAAGLTSR